MQDLGLLHLRVMDKIGAESAAKLVYDKFNDVLSKTGGGRVKVTKVECWEADKNSSIYVESDTPSPKSQEKNNSTRESGTIYND